MEAELEVNVAEGALETGHQEQAARRIVWVRLCGIEQAMVCSPYRAEQQNSLKRSDLSTEIALYSFCANGACALCCNNPCIKLSIVLGGTYMVIMEVEKEQNKTKQNKTKHACAFSPAVWSQNSSSSVVCSLWHHCSHLVSPVTWYSSRRPPAQPTWFEIYR